MCKAINGHNLPKNGGFTFVELLVTLAVAVIVLATAIPSLRAFVLNNRRAATVNEFATALNLARSEALSRAQMVVVCKVDNPDANTPTCQNGAAWQGGWVVYVDADNDGSIDVDEEIIRRYLGAAEGSTLMSSRNTGMIDFDRLGTTQGSFSTVAYCDDRGVDSGRQIVISNQGRIRVQDAASCAP